MVPMEIIGRDHRVSYLANIVVKIKLFVTISDQWNKDYRFYLISIDSFKKVLTFFAKFNHQTYQSNLPVHTFKG